MTIKQRMRLTEHDGVICMGEMEMHATDKSKILIWEPLWKSTCRWHSNCKMDLSQTGCTAIARTQMN